MTREQIALMSQEEREAAADALLESVDLMPLARALVGLLVDVWEQEQSQERAS